LAEQYRSNDALIGEVSRAVDRHGLLRPACGVVVGVSGGADSVALLAILHALSQDPARAYRLCVAHLDHGLRPDAAADAEFVAALAADRQIPCTIERRDVAAEARRRGCGIEEAARRLRYDFLREVASQHGAAAVAVGHHADDNVETVLYRLIRGTHLRGLAGIPVCRRLEGSEATLVRPLLGLRHADLEAFCRRAGLGWRTDPTNADTRLRRNFIRHELLPLLRECLNPSADEAIGRLAEGAAEVEAFLAELGAAAFARARRGEESARVLVDATTLAGEPRVVQAYAIRAALEASGVGLQAVGAERLAELGELVRSTGPGAVTLPGDYLARREGEIVTIGPAADPPADPPGEVALVCPGRTALPDGRQVDCRIEPFDPGLFEAHCSGHARGLELLDADRIDGSLVCRARRPGDAFHPLGSPGTQSVSDFLTNLKLPALRRDRVRCICDRRGIVYLAPLRIDQRVRLTGRTSRVLRVHLIDDPQ